MSNAPRKTPFAVGERVGMWVVLEILPPWVIACAITAIWRSPIAAASRPR